MVVATRKSHRMGERKEHGANGELILIPCSFIQANITALLPSTTYKYTVGAKDSMSPMIWFKTLPEG